MPSIQLFIAREKGFFREEGFDPQLIRMSANAAIAAGVAGELDALGSVGSAVRGIMRGVPLARRLRRSAPADFLAGVASGVPQCQRIERQGTGHCDHQRQPTFRGT